MLSTNHTFKTKLIKMIRFTDIILPKGFSIFVRC